MKKGAKKKVVKKVKSLRASYCTPTFNKVEYLADAVESFLEQKYENKELIIGDDCSTDKTYQLAEWYAKTYDNIKYFKFSENMGVASMRNRLIDASTGDIIFIMDADDMSEINRTAETMKVFNEKPEVSIVYSDCAVINGLGNHIDNLYAKEFQVWSLKANNYIPHPTIAFRKSIPVRYREGLRYIDDWYFYLDCVKAGLKFDYIPKLLSVYRPTLEGLTLKDGFSNKDKDSQRESLKAEFAEFDDDISKSLETKEHQKMRIKKILGAIPKGSKVLDLGANGGYIAGLLIKKGCKVKCFEIATNLVDVCKSKGLDVEKKDARDFQIDKEYDIVLVGDILEHMEPKDVKKVLDNSYNALKPGGKLIATVPYKHSFYSAERIVEHIRDYDTNDFMELCNLFKYKAEGIFCGDMSVSTWLFVVGLKQ